MTYRIGLDLDGVVYHFERTARYMLRRHISDDAREPSPMLDEPSQYWDHIRHYVEPQDWKWLWTDAAAEGLFRYGHVVGGAIEGATALAELGDVIIVTSRPKAAVHDTLAWLTFMLDEVPISGVHILGQEPKSSVRPEIDLFIDDAQHNVEELVANTGADIIVFDQPWNQEVRAAGRVQRAFGWRDVVDVAKEFYLDD